jgi:Family of unknown function (DUF6528)
MRHFVKVISVIVIVLSVSCMQEKIKDKTMFTHNHIICCGAEEVFIVDIDDKNTNDIKKWTWRASDSPEIPKDVHSSFRTTDECKPFGENILVTSSSGGVALISIRDKRCLFYTYSRNAHSACLLPGGRIVVASSTGGDELLVFDSNKSGVDIKPLSRMPLKGAHGVYWDRNLSELWALGDDELLVIDVENVNLNTTKLLVKKRWKLPTDGGHDLFPCRNERLLFVTTNTNVYRFDKTDGKFILDEQFGKLKKVKSIDENPKTGKIVYHRATPENWWSENIRFGDSQKTIHFKDHRLYKVRWYIPREILR